MAAAQPIGWFLFADSYLACAEALRRSPPADLRFDAPVRYLLFHAMELYLKAFLRLKGIGEDELRSRVLGHNLVALANRAEDLGLSKSRSKRLLRTLSFLTSQLKLAT